MCACMWVYIGFTDTVFTLYNPSYDRLHNGRKLYTQLMNQTHWIHTAERTNGCIDSCNTDCTGRANRCRTGCTTVVKCIRTLTRIANCSRNSRGIDGESCPASYIRQRFCRRRQKCLFIGDKCLVFCVSRHALNIRRMRRNAADSVNRSRCNFTWRTSS